MTFGYTRWVWTDIKAPKKPRLMSSRWIARAIPTADRIYSLEKGKLKIVLKLNKFGETPIKPKEYLSVTWNYASIFYHDLNPWIKSKR